ncbi:MAG: HAD family hydrolase [Chloroflexota bacterium]
MTAPRAVIFDLGGTLVEWPGWEDDSPRRWELSFEHLVEKLPNNGWPRRGDYVAAMREAELDHWRRVENEHWSGPPSGLLRDGFHKLGRRASEDELLTALDGYARAVDGWAIVVPDAQDTLIELSRRGYLLGLLSNTWWAAEWHNADLAAHGLAEFLDEIVYTSDLPHSKPHPSVFHELASRLGVAPAECVMVGDRMVDDISGAQGVGMRAVWVRNKSGWPTPDHVKPNGVIERLADLPSLLSSFGGA